MIKFYLLLALLLIGPFFFVGLTKPGPMAMVGIGTAQAIACIFVLGKILKRIE